MDKNRMKIGEPIVVGRMGYQIYSRVWNGKVRFSARVGKPFVSKESGDSGIVAEFESYLADDFLRAATQAKDQLDQMNQAAFQEKVNEQRSAISKAKTMDVALATLSEGGTASEVSES